MTISTYGELTAAVADWLDRADLAARIPDFIALAEAQIARKLTIRSTEGDLPLAGAAGQRVIALPEGYRDGKALWIVRAGERDQLRLVPPELLAQIPSPGAPLAWCVDGGSIVFDRPLDAPYAFILRTVSAAALSESSPTNLILANHPDLYLWGALKEAGPFLRDQELAGIFEAKFGRALDDAVEMEGRTSRRATLGTEIAQTRVDGAEGFDLRSGV